MERREKKNATRPCDCCGAESKRLYRVRTEKGGAWKFACDACWVPLKSGAEEYTYGGTWTARKR